MRERAALTAVRARGGVDHIAANILAVAPLPCPDAAWDPGQLHAQPWRHKPHDPDLSAWPRGGLAGWQDRPEQVLMAGLGRTHRWQRHMHTRAPSLDAYFGAEAHSGVVRPSTEPIHASGGSRASRAWSAPIASRARPSSAGPAARRKQHMRAGGQLAMALDSGGCASAGSDVQEDAHAGKRHTRAASDVAPVTPSGASKGFGEPLVVPGRPGSASLAARPRRSSGTGEQSSPGAVNPRFSRFRPSPGPAQRRSPLWAAVPAAGLLGAPEAQPGMRGSELGLSQLQPAPAVGQLFSSAESPATSSPGSVPQLHDSPARISAAKTGPSGMGDDVETWVESPAAWTPANGARPTAVHRPNTAPGKVQADAGAPYVRPALGDTARDNGGLGLGAHDRPHAQGFALATRYGAPAPAWRRMMQGVGNRAPGGAGERAPVVGGAAQQARRPGSAAPSGARLGASQAWRPRSAAHPREPGVMREGGEATHTQADAQGALPGWRPRHAGSESGPGSADDATPGQGAPARPELASVPGGAADRVGSAPAGMEASPTARLARPGSGGSPTSRRAHS